MKKLLLLSALLTLSTLAFSQIFEVTPAGLRDKGNLENSYVIITADGKTSAELYKNAVKYVNENYKNPEKVIKGNIENEFLSFETFVPQFTKIKNSYAKIPVSMKYRTELRIKDGKVRLEITELEITADGGGANVIFTGGIWEGFSIYKKNGEVRLPETKTDLENYFNGDISKIANTLLNKKTEKDNW